MKFEFEGEKIRQLAKDKGISITALAKEIGVTHKTIYDWNEGQIPQTHLYLELCFILGVGPYYFFKETS